MMTARVMRGDDALAHHSYTKQKEKRLLQEGIFLYFIDVVK